MTITYNDKQYEVTDDSIYLDFMINTGSIEDAVTIVGELSDIGDITFDETAYSNLVVKKRSIILDSRGVTVRVQLRQKTKAETTQEELDSLRTAMENLALTSSKTNAAKINKILSETGGE